MHSQKVLFDMVGAVELLLAEITVEGLLVAVDVLVAREEVAPVGGVGAGVARVALAGLGRARRRARRLRRARTRLARVAARTRATFIAHRFDLVESIE